MNIKELLKQDQGIEVRISAGTGHRDDPFLVEKCTTEESALTQVQLLRGIARGRDELWRIKEWGACDAGSATEAIHIEALWFTPAQVLTETRDIYFDTRAVTGNPYSLHPLTSWQGPPGTLTLPYELGWLHFDEVLNNTHSTETFDQTIHYSCPGAKASIYVYAKSDSDAEIARITELKRASDILLNSELEDPWPVVEIGSLAMKFFLSSSNITAVGVAVSGSYFVKLRLTFIDDPKMRELMNSTLMTLSAYLQYGSAAKY